MAKQDTANEIKAINHVELDVRKYTQKELEQLKEVAGDQPRFQALKAQFDDAGTPPDDNDEPPGASARANATNPPPHSTTSGDTQNVQPKAEAGNKRRVKLGPKAAADSSYFHESDKVTIGSAGPVAVTVDNWVTEKVRNQELDWA